MEVTQSELIQGGAERSDGGSEEAELSRLRLAVVRDDDRSRSASLWCARWPWQRTWEAVARHVGALEVYAKAGCACAEMRHHRRKRRAPLSSTSNIGRCLQGGVRGTRLKHREQRNALSVSQPTRELFVCGRMGCWTRII